MNKESFLEVGKEINGFEILEAENGPEGLTGQLLWDLWDIGVKFGSFFEKGIGFKAPPLVMELYDFRDNGINGSLGFIIGKCRPSYSTDEGVSFIELKNGIQVIWDNGFTVDDVHDIVKKIDIFALSQGIKVR